MEDVVVGRRDVAGVFDRAAATYGRVGPDFFDYFGRRAVELVKPGSGAIFLDVGCGTGASLVPAAALVADPGPVVGIDISPGMLLQAHRSLVTGNLMAHLAVADAGCIPLSDDSVDVIVSNFALTSFPSPENAVAEMRRVLKSGGRIATCISGGWWFQNDRSWRWHEDLLARLGVKVVPSRFQDQAALEKLFEAADFRITSMTTEAFPLRWRDARGWWAWNWSHGFREVLETFSASDLEHYRTRCFERLGAGPLDGQLEVLVALAQ